MEDKKKLHNILIVDDIPENVYVLDAILKPYYKRSVALHGIRALEIANSEFPPDLILLDVMLPDIDGFEVCERLKSNPKTKKIPVVFVTSKDEIKDEAKGFEAGGVDYIIKPVSPPIVLARVKTHLELYQSNERLEKQNEELRETAQLRENVSRMIHHDMKSPLQGIINYPDFLASDGNLTPSQMEILEDIKSCGYKILHMINISLDMVKMEMGVYKLKQKPVDLLMVINKVVAEMSHVWKSGGIALSILNENKPVSGNQSFLGYGEEFLCYSMFANLIKNAFEASKCNDLITIGLEKHDNAIIHIHNPTPVPESIKKNFFGKYVTFGKEGGTGLGTYSAMLMAKTQNGTINLKSSPEQGTTVSVFLPSVQISGAI